MANTQIIDPIVLTSILPFGVNEDGSAFRFSLCIDLLSNYQNDPAGNPTAPNVSKLQKFFLNFGTNKNIIGEIKKNFRVKIVTNSGKSFSYLVKPCFENYFGNNNQYWDLLLTSNNGGYKSLLAEANEIKQLNFKNNDFFQNIKNIEKFSSNLSVHTFYSELATTVRSIRNNQAPPVSEIFESLESKAREFVPDIFQANQHTKGIHDYSLKNNLNQFTDHAKNFLLNTPKVFSDYCDENFIREVFSFIASNSVLQRFFNTTIDFEIPSTYLRSHLRDGNKFTISINTEKSETNADTGTYFDTDKDANVLWKHLSTGVIYFRRDGFGDVIILQNESNLTPWVSRTLKQHLSLTNYDAGSKLKDLTPLLDKIRELKNKTSVTESDRYKLYKDLIALDSAALTRGMNLYNEKIDEDMKEFMANVTKPAPNPLDNISNSEDLLDEVRVIKGYKFGIAGSAQPIIPLGNRILEIKNEKNKPIPLPDTLKTQDFAVNTDTAMHALVEKEKADGSGKEIQNSLVIDSAILTWSGENIGMPSVFSVNEDETNFEHNESEGSIEESTDIVSNLFLKFFKEEYGTIGMHYHGTVKGLGSNTLLNQDSSDFNFRIVNKAINMNYYFTNNAKLLLGKVHKLCMIPQYKNGWGLNFNSSQHELGYSDLFKTNAFIDFTFKRNEPVKPVQFFLQDQLLENYEEILYEKKIQKQRAIKGRDGESLYHLVIRNYNKDDDKVYETHQKSVRYILPPQISFEHALWHNKIFEMNTDESYDWYVKYHFPIIEGEFKKDKNGNIIKDVLGMAIKHTEDEAVEGSIVMRRYYSDKDKWYIPDSWEHDKIINYLSDPLSRGFRLEFYLDKNKTKKATDYEKYEQNEYYFSGKYPKINAWRIIVSDIDGDELLTFKNEKIFVYVDKGKELFITARTILDDVYESQFETYGNYNDFTKYGNNDLLTPPLEFSIVHATQRPLVTPKFNNTLFSKKEFGKTFLTLINTINIEQLDIYETEEGITKYIEETIPTGRIELYAKWEQYIDDPNHLISEHDNWTPNEPVNKINKDHFYKNKDENAILETSITIKNNLKAMEGSLNKIGDESNTSMNYSTDVKVDYDVRETKFIEKWFWIKNKSKFTSYFPSDWGIEETSEAVPTDHQTHKDYFNKTSKEAFLIKILNNKKPDKPQLANRNITLISVIEDHHDGNNILRNSSLNRLRFYFERGRFSSGKGEKIGFVLNEPGNKYNDYLITNNLISTTGKDIVSDSVKPYDGLYRNENVLLQKSNFVVHDPYDLKDYKTGEKADDIESFGPQYVKDLGLMTFVPRLDKNLNKWYLDIELDINASDGKELHNPFLQFAIVNYQENSWNYNEENNTNDISKDCRISEIQKSGFVYIMGSRTMYVEPSRNNVKVHLNCDMSSLINIEKKLQTVFYAFIQNKPSNEAKWITYTGEEKNKKELPLIHFDNNSKFGSLSYGIGNGDYRLVVIESEYRYDALSINALDLTNLLEDKNSRIIMVNLFDL
jgi:hypothetical protein